MRKLHRIFALIIFCLVFFTSFLFEAVLTREAATGFLTAFSIITGFYFSSVAVIISSKSVTRLYREEDPYILGQTKLQTYKKYYLNSFYWSGISIIIMMMYLIDSTMISKFFIANVNHFIDSISIAISFVNIYWSVILFQTLMTLMLYEGRDK